MSAPALPPGYVRDAVGAADFVARDWSSDAMRQALLQHGSLYRWAAAQTPRQTMRGRGIAWAVDLPAGAGDRRSTAVVVRHSRHGGLLAPLTGDLFVRPTRAPRELATAARLAAGGVPTPEIIAYAMYPVAGFLARSDVITRRLPDGRDFPEAWRADASPSAREAMIDAVSVLLRALSAQGAHHPDLNVKNVYMAGSGVATIAYVLDVDRITFANDAQVSARNFARFARSARKWNEEQALDVSDAALVRLASQAWVDA